MPMSSPPQSGPGMTVRASLEPSSRCLQASAASTTRLRPDREPAGHRMWRHRRTGAGAKGVTTWDEAARGRLSAIPCQVFLRPGRLQPWSPFTTLLGFFESLQASSLQERLRFAGQLAVRYSGHCLMELWRFPGSSTFHASSYFFGAHSIFCVSKTRHASSNVTIPVQSSVPSTVANRTSKTYASSSKTLMPIETIP